MASNLKPSGWIMTRSGIKFDIFNPRAADVKIEDIAHAQSMLCRFNGTCKKFYSIAQHSVLVSRIDDSLFPLEKLLHDGTEFVLGDVVRPLKIWLKDYIKYEDKVDKVIAKAFKLSRSQKCLKEVKRADNIALVTEARDLLDVSDGLCEYCPDVEPLKTKIRPWSQQKAYREFMKRFDELVWGHSMQWSQWKPYISKEIENFQWEKMNILPNTQTKKLVPVNI